MPDSPQVNTPSAQQAGDPSVSAPSSGTYGEQSALDTLKKSLPIGNVGNPSPPGQPGPPVKANPIVPPPGPEGRPGSGVAIPPGMPAGLLAPTQQPGTSVSTPLQQPAGQTVAATGAANPQQARLATLFTLTSNPNVSSDTRQWAKALLDTLVHGG